MDQRILDAVQIGPHWQKIWTQVDIDTTVRPRRVALRECGLNDVPNLSWRKIEFKFPRFEPRHLRRFLDETVQPVALFINDRQQLTRLTAIWSFLSQQTG